MSLASVKHCELNTKHILACWLGGLLLVCTSDEHHAAKLKDTAPPPLAPQADHCIGHWDRTTRQPACCCRSTTHLPPPLACALIRLAGVVWISFIFDEDRHVCGGRLDLFLAEPPALSAHLRYLRLERMHLRRLPRTHHVDRANGTRVSFLGGVAREALCGTAA
jgi:hypothetical protein